MIKQLAIFFGGGIGALLRSFIYSGVTRFGISSWTGTLAVNVIGSLVLLGLLPVLKELPENYSAFFRVGMLGALTTFSTLALDVFQFVKSGSYLQALLVVSLNVLFGIVVGVILFK